MGRKPPHPRRGAGLGPTKPRERRPWLQSEVHSLRVAFATFGDDWRQVVAALTKDGHDVRTELAVQAKVTDLKLRKKDERRSSGGDWQQQKEKQGDKNKKRAAKAAAKSDTSPPAEEPRPKRASTERPTPTADSGDPATAPPVLPESARRLAIAHYFLEVMDAPPEEEWSERQGTVWCIRMALKIPSGSHSSVLRVLQDVTRCAEEGVVYTGERKAKRRAQALLQVGTPCAKVVANCMERGLGLRRTTVLLNFSRQRRKLLPVGVSSVYGLHLAMKPVVTSITDNKQGKTDPDTHWSRGRHAFFTQLAIRRGFLDVERRSGAAFGGRRRRWRGETAGRSRAIKVGLGPNKRGFWGFWGSPTRLSTYLSHILTLKKRRILAPQTYSTSSIGSTVDSISAFSSARIIGSGAAAGATRCEARARPARQLQTSTGAVTAGAVAAGAGAESIGAEPERRAR